MIRLFLMVDEGRGPVSRKQFGADVSRAWKYWMKFSLVTARSAWLVDAENADAARGTIELEKNPPPVGEAFTTTFAVGRILASKYATSRDAR